MTARKRTKVIRKKKWKDMEIFRVKLDPHQAVLSCCDSVDRLPEGLYATGQQCWGLCPGTPWSTSAS